MGVYLLILRRAVLRYMIYNIIFRWVLYHKTGLKSSEIRKNVRDSKFVLRIFVSLRSKSACFSLAGVVILSFWRFGSKRYFREWRNDAPVGINFVIARGRAYLFIAIEFVLKIDNNEVTLKIIS